jgi:hypothetical protein
MIEKISLEELDFYETMCNPVACTEILFHDFDNIGSFDEDKFGEVRKYQYPFLGFDTLFIENKELSKKANFEIKNGLSDSYTLGGRLTGKTLFCLIVDCIISTFHKTYNWGVVSSLDFAHIKNVMEKIILGLENHPILKLLETHQHTQRNPYKVVANNGCLLESVNDNLVGKNPGQNWYAKHVDKNWVEEASFMTKQVTNKRLMSQSELGCIDRFSGMTTFPKVSPMGEIFYNLKNENKIINLPSYVNPTWDEKKDDAAILEFGGKNSVGYQVQILGKVVENGDSVYDIDRIRETYKKDVAIKAFEINRDNYFRYKEILVLERPANAESLHVHLDIGEGGAPTEIIVLPKINGIYRYIYNITVFKISPDEQKDLVKHIIEILKANVIGIDVTSGGGKALFSSLSKDYPNNIFGVAFNENIDIDFEKDSSGNVQYSNDGKPKLKQERVDAWSIQCLKNIFYNKKIKCLFDMKLDAQFDSVIVTSSKQGKILYGCKIENHLHQAFQVFAIVDFLTEFAHINPIESRKPGLGVFGSI